MKHKTKGFIAMILALCLMMSLGIGALADPQDATDVPLPPGEMDPLDDPETYTVTVNFSNATVEVNGAEATSGTANSGFSSGQTINITYDAAGGYAFSGATASEGVNFSYSDGQLSFVMPSGNVSINMGFSTAYNITLPTGLVGGSVSCSGSVTQYSTITLTATANEGYELTELKANDKTIEFVKQADGTYTGSFKMPDANVTVTATFTEIEEQTDQFPIDIVQSTGGSVNASLKAAAKGTEITLSYTANANYTFAGYNVQTQSGTAVTVENGKFTMPSEGVTVSATFVYNQPPVTPTKYDISTWDNSKTGFIQVKGGISQAEKGDIVKFLVGGYYTDNCDITIYKDGTYSTVEYYLASDGYYTFTMPASDVTIRAYFYDDYVGTYSITKDVEGDGSIYVRSSADRGDTVWIEASPNAGQSLTSLRVFYGEPWAYGDKGYYGYWNEADVHYSEYWDAYYFTMPDDDVVVYARFTDGATVDVIAGDHGDAKVSSRYAEKGDWVYITAYPDEGYEVDSVTVTDSLGRSVKVTELSYDYFLFTMPGTSVDVKVTFRAKDYDVFYDVSRGDWYYKAVRFVHEKGIMEGTGTHYFSPEADLSRGMLATILYRLEGSPAVSGYSGFADVADTAYYAKAVAWAKANGIVNGVTATAYEPDTAVTREELAAILCRYAAFKGKDTAISYDYLAGFSDANTSHVYARPALNWAVAYDIINGQGNGVLAPRATATRAEVAQVLMNYLEVFD